MKKIDGIDEMPIVKSVIAYKEKNTISLHVPGHKKGQSFAETGMEFPWSEALKYDTTEVDVIDNLHFPERAIMEAEEKAAKLFGADKTFFLVNGTTAGILAMIHSVAVPGDSIIIPRNCHKSVFNAIVLGRLNPIYLLPESDDLYRVGMGINPEDVEAAFEKNPSAKAVLITSPSYYGICCDIEKIAEIAHRRGKVLLVDEAHGAHFCFSEDCPKSALACGADAVAQSTHKCLSSFTGTSMLHISGKKIDLEKIRFYLQAYQTTSPNHILLAGLDAARYQMEKKEGRDKLEEVICLGKWAKTEINRIPGLRAIDDSLIGSSSIYAVDPTRLSISVKMLGITGVYAEKYLRDSFNIQIEMADAHNIVAIFSIGNRKEDFVCFVDALKELSNLYFSRNDKINDQKEDSEWEFNRELPEIAMNPWDAIFGSKKRIPIEICEEEIAAEMLIPYPPGIPIIMPGERISKNVVEYINICLKNGIKVNSSIGNKQGYISVAWDSK